MPQIDTAARLTAVGTTPPNTPTDSSGPILSGTCNVEAALQRLEQMCTSPRRPLRFEPHCKGIYQHNGQTRTRPGEEFRDSNPPPEIWASYMRIKSNMDSYRDRLRVDLFIENHAFWAADLDNETLDHGSGLS